MGTLRPKELAGQLLLQVGTAPQRRQPRVGIGQQEPLEVVVVDSKIVA